MTLLACTDFSAPSRHAVKRALQLAKENTSDVCVAHAMDESQFVPLHSFMQSTYDNLRNKLQDQTKVALHNLVSELAAELNGVAGVNEYVGAGHPLQALPQQADALDAELIVTGAKGVGFLRRLGLGSIASGLLRATARPVLVVKQPVRAPYQRVLLPVDFSREPEKTIEFAQRWLPNAQLFFLHVCDLPHEERLLGAGVEVDAIAQLRKSALLTAQDKLEELAKQAGIAKSQCLVREGDPTSQILTLEQELACDLIVQGRRGGSLLSDFLLGSVTKHVLVESQCDVLVC